MKFIILFFLFVSCSFAKSPKKEISAITPYKMFSSYEFDGDHAGGATLWLWKKDKKDIRGIFIYYEGEPSQRGAQKIQKVIFDEKKSSLAFEVAFLGDAKLKCSGNYDQKQFSIECLNFGKYKMPLITDKKAYDGFFKAYKSEEAWKSQTPPDKIEY